MTKKSKNQKCTDFLIKCLEICADPDSFNFDSYENLNYFCNAAAIIGYDEEKDDEKQEYCYAIDLFYDLYKEDAEEYIFEEFCDCNQQAAVDYLSIGGYFGRHTEESNQEHRLIAIAFAAAVSETED